MVSVLRGFYECLRYFDIDSLAFRESVGVRFETLYFSKNYYSKNPKISIKGHSESH